MRSILVLLVTFVGTASAAPGDDPSLTFEARIRPILKTHCFQCHGEQADGKPKGKLDVRLKRLLVKGGRSGPAIVAGRRNESVLYQNLTKGEMPPEDVTKRPTKQEIELIGRWIDLGAP